MKLLHFVEHYWWKICNHENAKYQIMDVPMSGEDIVEILQVQFEDMGVIVSLTERDDMPVNTASCNGYFYHQDWDGESNIELEVVVRDTNDVIIINNNATKRQRGFPFGLVAGSA